MKLIKSTMAVLALASCALFAAAGCAEATPYARCSGRPAANWPIEPEAYVKRNCSFCHGPAVEGRYVAPRLAGQHADYVATQMLRLRDKTRDNPFSRKHMGYAAAETLPGNDCEIGHYLASLPAQPANDGVEALVGQGEEIFKRGIPEDNIPACQFCHGPQGQGIGVFPRLSGQSYYYLRRRLGEWVEGYSAVAAHMPAISKKLSPEQVDAVTSYLSFQQ
jgi:cytochrome c553